VSMDSYKIEQVSHRWFVRVFLILLHKAGSFLHGPFRLAEVIGARGGAANRRSFSDV
jgi:hypothetical protein